MEHINLQDLFEYSRATRVVKEVHRTDWFNVKPNHMIFVPKDGVRGIAPRTLMSLVGIQQPH